MKKRYLTGLLILAVAGFASAREKIKDGTATSSDTDSEPSAILEVESTSRGFLPPRLTTTGRDAVSGWAEGTVIYNTTSNSIECYNGTAWVVLSLVADVWKERSAAHRIIYV